MADEDEGPVDISLETTDGGHYQMPAVLRKAVEASIAKAVNDGTTFSITNGSGAALVVPWASVTAVYQISIYAPNEVSWDVLWRKCVAEQECVTR